MKNESNNIKMKLLDYVQNLIEKSGLKTKFLMESSEEEQNKFNKKYAEQLEKTNKSKIKKKKGVKK